MTHEEKACEIVNNFKGATVDHFGCCLMQEQIVRALERSYDEGLKASCGGYCGVTKSLEEMIKESWNEAITAAVKILLKHGYNWTASKIEALRKG